MGFVIYMQGFVFALALFALGFIALGFCTLIGALCARKRFFSVVWRIWLWSSVCFACLYAPCFMGALFLFKWMETLPKDDPATRWGTLVFLLGPFLIPGVGFMAGVGWGMKKAMALKNKRLAVGRGNF